MTAIIGASQLPAGDLERVQGGAQAAPVDVGATRRVKDRAAGEPLGFQYNADTEST